MTVAFLCGVSVTLIFGIIVAAVAARVLRRKAAQVLCENCVHGSHVDCPEGRVWCDKLCRYMVYEGYCSYGKKRCEDG